MNPQVLTKAELVEDIYNHIGLSKCEAKEIVELFFEEIKMALVDGKTVKISGLGNFKPRCKKERPGRNPKTGEEVAICARRVVTFRAGQKLRSRVERYAGTRKLSESQDSSSKTHSASEES